MRNKLSHLKRDINHWSLLLVIICVIISVPILTIVFHLFGGVGEMWDHIVDHFLLDYLSNSAVLLIGTGILCFLFGTSSAWIIANFNFPFRKVLDRLLFLPMAIPSYITAYAYVGLFEKSGMISSWFQYFGIEGFGIDFMNIYGLIWVLSCSLFPYVYAATKALFISIPKSFFEASKLLGASNSKYFFSIAIPLAIPAIIGGLFLVFMEVLNDFGAAKYYGVNTFTTGIFRSWTMLEDLQSAIYLAALLVVVVFIIQGFITWRLSKRSFSFSENTDSKPKGDLKGYKKWLAMFVVFIPLFFGLILPLIQLLNWAYITFDSMFTYELFSIALDSIMISLVATVLIVTVAFLLLFIGKWNNLKSLIFFPKLGTIGYVIPGAIIGIGVMRSSQGVINFFEENFHLEIGFLFYGSSVVLVMSYLFRFLAIAYHPIESNSFKLGNQLSDSSLLLGVNKWKTLFKIDAPLLRNALIGASFLVFIDIIKELPLTLILKPYKLNTLAVSAYAYADDEQVAKAALPSLVLIVIILLFMEGVRKVFNTQKKK